MADPDRCTEVELHYSPIPEIGSYSAVCRAGWPWGLSAIRGAESASNGTTMEGDGREDVIAHSVRSVVTAATDTTARYGNGEGGTVDVLLILDVALQRIRRDADRWIGAGRAHRGTSELRAVWGRDAVGARCAAACLL